jgi:hypothetical protein
VVCVTGGNRVKRKVLTGAVAGAGERSIGIWADVVLTQLQAMIATIVASCTKRM